MRRALWAVLLLAACDGESPADAGVADAGSDAALADAGPPVVVLPDDRAPCAERSPLRRPLFGDLHVHTALSFDANRYGTRARPRDVYRFARGETLALAPYDAAGEPTRTLRLERPLDFAAVTDHAEFFAQTDICTDPSSPGYGSATCTSYRAGDPAMPDWGELTNLLITPGTPARVCRSHPELCVERAAAVWQEVQDAAEEFQDRTSSCAFTTFVGYEWTGNPGAVSLHRNVIFRGRSVQRVPVSYLDAPTPELLHARLEATCLATGTPCDLVSIPHNGNLGGGRMFVPVADDGTPFDRAAAERRARIEPLVEIYQHKGASECLPPGLGDPLASEDERCRFEMYHPNLCGSPGADPSACAGVCAGGGIGFLGGCVGPGDFARGALRNGLAELARVGANPWQLGFIGSTDTHIAAAGAVDEASYPGHAGEMEDEPRELLALPPGALTYGRTGSPGGLAVVWAEENSREAIFDAMRRRETYATSGPRITARFFAGWSYPSELCELGEQLEHAYRDGVPMGGELRARPEGAAPTFFVSALRDALGAPLGRLEIVKGWLEVGGETRERLYTIAAPGEGASVDPASCARSGEGLDALCETWTDPDFDPSVPAFWYARVLEVPTCRWSRALCNAQGLDCAAIDASHPMWSCCDPTVEHVIEERAWTSPIWYVP
ncbi:MAG: DUF3604 domain-containing protein [Sandaracinaceae bacterium]|nr:DUF3604 domain-containing protein [Sandaracinaceae bacterium]